MEKVHDRERGYDYFKVQYCRVILNTQEIAHSNYVFKDQHLEENGSAQAAQA